MSWGRLALLLLLGALPSAPCLGDEAPSGEQLLAEIASLELDIGAVREVRPVTLATGLANLRLESGYLIPATAVGGRPRELVFLGDAELRLDPPDDIEAAQLELFTGRRSLRIDVRSAVLVLGQDAAAEHLFGGGSEAALDPTRIAEATDLFARWQQSGERQTLNVDLAVMRNAWGDPLFQSYFAGWFQSDEIEDFLYLSEPDAREQVTVGRFTPLETTRREEREIRRLLHREHKRGRLIGLELEHLGQWDTWLSASLQDDRDQPRRGLLGPRVDHYDIALEIERRSLDTRARAVLTLTGEDYATRFIALQMHPDLRVDAVRSTDGADLFFHQRGGEILIRLTELLAPNEERKIEIDYSGHLIAEVDRARYLVDTLYWYPQTRFQSRATYDVRFQWPEPYELVGSGTRVDGGEADRMRWERRRLDVPSWAFSFEIGRFDIIEGRAGEIPFRLAIDPLSSRLLDDTDELVEAIRDALTYYEEIFAPYPFGELNVVTTPRAFSQSPPGFVTLSALAVSDNWMLRLFLQDMDRRVLIAHELAHQWWGHLLAWESYRDQWISEAMANYAATLYARNELGKGNLRPIGAWQSRLLERTADERPIESLGPVVLGERLVSSQSETAYLDIVYRKGTVVLDMLSRRFGEESFLQVLRVILDGLRLRTISTGDLLTLIERITEIDLDAFADQFIYGTGLPIYYYDYEIEEMDDGRWLITGSAEQQAPYRYRYGFRQLGDGSWDVERQPVELIGQGSNIELVVPVQVAVFDPDHSDTSESGPDPSVRGNRIVQYHVLLRGESTPLRLELDLEPKQLWLDAGQWVFGRFFNRTHDPKRIAMYRGLDLAAAGDPEAGLERLDTAWRAELRAAPRLTGSAPDESALEIRSLRLDAAILFEKARLQLDLDEVASAAESFETAVSLYGAANRRTRNDRDLPDAARLLEARLDLRQGETGRAFRALKREVLRKENLSSLEAYILLAIASHATGNRKELERALEAIEERGVEPGPFGRAVAASR